MTARLLCGRTELMKNLLPREACAKAAQNATGCGANHRDSGIAAPTAKERRRNHEEDRCPVSGDGAALYQTRCAAGNLGDLIILDNADMSECVDAGLVYDLKGIIENYPNLMKFQKQIEMIVRNLLVGDRR